MYTAAGIENPNLCVGHEEVDLCSKKMVLRADEVAAESNCDRTRHNSGRCFD